MVLKPYKNNGKNYQPQLVSRISHQQYDLVAMCDPRISQEVFLRKCPTLRLAKMHLDVSKNVGIPKWMVNIMENPKSG